MKVLDKEIQWFIPGNLYKLRKTDDTPGRATEFFVGEKSYIDYFNSFNGGGKNLLKIINSESILLCLDSFILNKNIKLPYIDHALITFFLDADGQIIWDGFEVVKNYSEEYYSSLFKLIKEYYASFKKL